MSINLAQNYRPTFVVYRSECRKSNSTIVLFILEDKIIVFLNSHDITKVRAASFKD